VHWLLPGVIRVLVRLQFVYISGLRLPNGSYSSFTAIKPSKHQLHSPLNKAKANSTCDFPIFHQTNINQFQYSFNHLAFTMPSGFAAFRHDPTTAPRYIDRSSTSTSEQSQRYRDSASGPKEGAKLSKYQYPTERGM